MFKDKKGKYHVAWFGCDNPNMGYGSSNKALKEALAQNGIIVHDVITDTEGAEKCDVGIAYSTAGQGALEMLPTPYRIMFTMFEADRFPQSWVSTCNCANQVWVPSEFCKDALLKSGCESPVHVVPLGFDPKAFYPTEPARSNEYTFGYVGSATMRKGFDLLQKAFLDEFKPDENAKLLIHSSNIISSAMIDDPRIEYSTGTISQDELRDIYGRMDLFVMPTKGEGFGLTALESMACGTPVAVTGFGGSMDYMHHDCLHIGIDGMESCKGYHGSEGEWAKPSMASIRYCMRYAFENPELMKMMGSDAEMRVCEDWVYQITANDIKALLKDTDPAERVETEFVDVIVWTGNPRNVRTKIGAFIRGEARELTPEQTAMIDLNDTRFRRERRYRRIK